MAYDFNQFLENQHNEKEAIDMILNLSQLHEAGIDVSSYIEEIEAINESMGARAALGGVGSGVGSAIGQGIGLGVDAGAYGAKKLGQGLGIAGQGLYQGMKAGMGSMGRRLAHAAGGSKGGMPAFELDTASRAVDRAYKAMARSNDPNRTAMANMLGRISSALKNQVSKLQQS